MTYSRAIRIHRLGKAWLAVVWGVLPPVIAAACSDGGPTTSDADLELQRLAPAHARIEVWDTLVFSATSDREAVPAQRLEWSASDRRVLRKLTAGRFEARAVGPATVTAISPSGVSASIDVEVSPAWVASLRLSEESIELVRTDSTRIVVSPLDRKGHPIYGILDGLTFTSEDPSIATVDADGIVRGVGLGETRILLTLDDVHAEVAVRVRERSPLEVDDDSVRLRLGGERFRVTATLEGSPTPIESLALVSEARWVEGESVVSLRGDTIVAHGPGSARIEASAPPAYPDTLELRVEPDGPTVFFGPADGRYSEGEAVTLRGWRLDAPGVGPVRLGGATAGVLYRDSATLRVSVPTQSGTGCSGDARRTVTVDGAEVLPEAPLVVARPDEITIQPGATHTPSPGDCLRLRADSTARWALAVTDADVWSPVDRLAPFNETEPPTPVVLEDRGAVGTPPAAVPAPFESSRSHGPDLVESLHPVPPGKRRRALEAAALNRPYEIGDTVRLDLWNHGLFRVETIWKDQYVLFFAEDTPLDFAVPWIEAAVDDMDQRLGALLDPLVGGPPRDEFGQYRIYVDWGTDRYHAGVAGETGMSILVYRDYGRLDRLITHEYAHSYQNRVASQERAQGRSGGSYRRWNLEGLADFTAQEVLREAHGVPADANLRVDARDDLSWLTGEVRDEGGGVLQGYGRSSGLNRYLVRLWMEGSGVSRHQAFRAVFKGVTLGWWGCHGELPDCSSTGMAESLAKTLGHPVDPADVFLDWALAQAGDDRDPTEHWRNELFQLASGSRDHFRDPAPDHRGWTPAVVFVSGAGDVSFEMPQGGIEWIAVRDVEGRGVTLRLPEDSRWSWRLLRIR